MDDGVSNRELLEAYDEGAISRRTLIRRLVAGGMSLGAAVAYAQLLGRDTARAALSLRDHYEFVEIKASIEPQDLDDVVASGKVLTKVSTDRKGLVHLEIYLSRPGETYPYSWIGVKEVNFKKPGKKRIKVPLGVNPPHSVDALAGRSEAKLSLLVREHRNRDPRWGYAADERTLRP